jgi:hypothetical protein
MSGRRAWRVAVLALALLGVVAWYAPASAFNYGKLAGRSVAAPVVGDQSAFVAASTDSCTLAKGAIGSQTCQVYFYNNATTTMTLGASLQDNTLVGSWSCTMDSNGCTTGTGTSAAKAKGEWAFFNLTWSSVPLSCATGCTLTSFWQINGTSSTPNALATHQDHWPFTVTFG